VIKKTKSNVDMYVLKYGKLSAKVILRNCYYTDALSLSRKAKLAQGCVSSRSGWTKSKTVTRN